MDKRWIGIILIIIIASICGYFIVTSSNTVGSAITDVNKSVVSLPSGFSVKEDNSRSTTLFNKHTLEEIYIEDLGKNNIALDEFNTQIKNLSSNKTVDIIKNTTNITDEFELYNVFYKNGTKTMSLSYIYKNNHTYMINCTEFNDVNDLTNKLNFIADTLKPDYKKSQD